MDGNNDKGLAVVLQLHRWSQTRVELGLLDRLKFALGLKTTLEEEMIAPGCVGFAPVFDDYWQAQEFAETSGHGAEVITVGNK